MDDIFKSYFMGGFECATQVFTGPQPYTRPGNRVDNIAETAHDTHCVEDYGLLQSIGIKTVRDGLRWHLIESTPGRYDFGSWERQLEAAKTTGTQVIWDLTHYGVPDYVDMWSPDFPKRFTAFAQAAGERFRQVDAAATPLWCPHNEINTFTNAGTVEGVWKPGQGDRDLFRGRLIEGTLAAQRALRRIDPRARFVQCEYYTFTVGLPGQEARAQAENDYAETTYDLIAGRTRPELGGSEDMLDILGVNFHRNSTAVYYEDGRREFGLGVDHPHFVPLSVHLAGLSQRYRRPLIVSECGAEGEGGPAALHYAAKEGRLAQEAGVNLLGICTAPAMDYPGWVDYRHCPTGFITLSDDWQARRLNAPMAAALREEQAAQAAFAASPRPVRTLEGPAEHLRRGKQPAAA